MSDWDEKQVWTRRKGESRPAYAAFCLYRDMRETRSYAEVARKLGKSKTLIERWGIGWLWQNRVDAYDADLESKKLVARNEAITQMAERHAKIAVAVQQKLVSRLQEIEPSELSPSDLIRWFSAAVKIERLSRGEPTEHTRIDSPEKALYRRVELAKNALEESMQLFPDVPFTTRLQMACDAFGLDLKDLSEIVIKPI
jgi:hypothetical protein